MYLQSGASPPGCEPREAMSAGCAERACSRVPSAPSPRSARPEAATAPATPRCLAWTHSPDPHLLMTDAARARARSVLQRDNAAKANPSPGLTNTLRSRGDSASGCPLLATNISGRAARGTVTDHPGSGSLADRHASGGADDEAGCAHELAANG